MATLVEIIQNLLNTNSGNAEIIASLIILAAVGFVGWACYVVFNRLLL
jgi:hypothetical protein